VEELRAAAKVEGHKCISSTANLLKETVFLIGASVALLHSRNKYFQISCLKGEDLSKIPHLWY
jgi:hypothetical protein